MKRISIIPNTEKDINLEYTKKTAEILSGFKKEVCLLSGTEISGNYTFLPYDELVKTDMIVVLGGDGTILGVSEASAKNKTPILGINIGNLGFLTQAEDVSKEIFRQIFDGNYTVSENMMLSASVVENGCETARFTALNDVVVKGEGARMLNVKLDIDNINTNNYPADGVIISTATGSTAYSLSAGGAILHPELDAIMITPVCPHTLKARCMIIPSGKTVTVSLLPPYRTYGVLTVDGKVVAKLNENAYVTVCKSNLRTYLINLNKRSFYDIVREKIADRSI